MELREAATGLSVAREAAGAASGMADSPACGAGNAQEEKIK